MPSRSRERLELARGSAPRRPTPAPRRRPAARRISANASMRNTGFFRWISGPRQRSTRLPTRPHRRASASSRGPARTSAGRRSTRRARDRSARRARRRAGACANWLSVTIAVGRLDHALLEVRVERARVEVMVVRDDGTGQPVAPARPEGGRARRSARSGRAGDRSRARVPLALDVRAATRTASRTSEGPSAATPDAPSSPARPGRVRLPARQEDVGTRTPSAARPFSRSRS